MIDLIFLELALAFVIVATLATVATTGGSRPVRGVANKTVNGSFTAALVSVALTVWSIFWPPTSNRVRLPAPTTRPNPSGPIWDHDRRGFGYTLRRGPSPCGQQARTHALFHTAPGRSHPRSSLL